MRSMLLVAISLSALMVVGQPSAAQSGNNSNHSLFHTPALDASKENQPATPPLATQISSIAITASPGELLLRNLCGLEVSVRNDTKQPLIVDAENAVAQIGSAKYEAATGEVIDKAAKWSGTPAQRAAKSTASILIAGATIGAYQTMRDEWIQSGPILRRYGKNQVRKEKEVETFGNRVIWPGDTRTGVMYFVGAPSLGGADLQIPVRGLFDSSEHATLLFHIPAS